MRHRRAGFLVTVAAAAPLAAVFAAIGLGPSPASAAPSEHLRDQQACAATLKKVKEQEQTGSLLEARDLSLSCSVAPCADFVRRQCATEHAKLTADTPTVVFVVTDAAGAERNDVQVRIDGTLLEGSPEGRPVEVDPGFHDFSFIAGGRVFATQKVLIVQGQRNRFVTATVGGTGESAAPTEAQPSLVEAPVPPVKALRPPISSTPTGNARRAGAPAGKKTGAKGEAKGEVATAGNDSNPTGAPAASDDGGGSAGDEQAPAAAAGTPGKYRWLPLALIGVAAASAGVGAMFTIWGRRDNDLLSQCAPNCSIDAVDRVRHRYTQADVAFGVGVAALGAAYWAYALARSGGSTESAGGESALRLDVAPLRSGGVASVSGRF